MSLLTLVQMDLPHRLSADIAESGHPLQPPTPEEAEKYAHKPLPPIPSSSYFRRKDPSTRADHTSPDEDAIHLGELPLTPKCLPSTTPTLSRRRHSMSQTINPKQHRAMGHRSSQKIMQITGQEVDATHSSPYQPGRPAPAARMSDSGWAAFGGSAALRKKFLDQIDETSPVPPSLEIDRDGSSKSHDSWEPVSPGSAQPAPWLPDAAVAEAHHDSDFAGGHVRSASSESDSKVRDLFNLHSTDYEVAWSYHTIAAELAAHKRPATSHGVEETSRQAPRPKSRRFTKLLHSSSSNKLRSALPTIITSLEPRPASRQVERPRPRISHLGPSGNMPASASATATVPVPVPVLDAMQQQQQQQQSAVPQSAFDESDSEDDDEARDQSRWGASPALVKDWLARRGGDGGASGNAPTAVRSSLVRRRRRS
ncbi:hypothetical protein HJFPF1_00738 [Paramyrothecium foliicola]|nr:hypothetical protein HJFPF1_00738 [Paramyrothecium foliicola]